ncbi:MAG TPA: hypothetical protein VFZ22_18710, partial [Pyrinomonadaceae bacterium]|nr:hypothetical protein [Pyrinomonadaceae bacterium]
VSTREATVTQLVVTFVVMVAAPLLFFLLQAATVNYATGADQAGLLRKAALDSLKFIAVSLPVIALTILGVWLIGKLQGRLAVDPNTLQPVSVNKMTLLIVLRYLLVGVVAPLVTIQLWIAASTDGLLSSIRNVHKSLGKAFAPQAMLVFACGFLVFAVAPYFLLSKTMNIQRAWLELSVLTVRVVVSALMILLGWVTTVGAISILSRETPVVQE